MNVNVERDLNNNLTKDYLKAVGTQNTDLANLVRDHMGNGGELTYILENVGRLPASFDADCIIPLLYNKNVNVRYWAVKVIGKLKSEKYLETLYKIANEDESSIVKREAVSSIGRMRLQKTIPYLKQMLSNDDPKIVCQVIRALLVFKGLDDVDNILKQMSNHENEMIRNVIHKEYFVDKSQKTSCCPHQESFPFLRNVIVNGDVIEVLKNVPNESFHLTFTSPPYYNARDYSIYPSYEAYLNFLDIVFKEVYRTTKEGRFLIVNTSPVIIPRISRAHSSKRYPIPFDLHHYLVQMGWEFIDDIVWEKPEYSVKNRIGGFQQHRKPLAYKPNSVTEYLMVYRKKTDKLIDWNIHQYDFTTVENSKVADGYETTNVWKICPKSDKVHSAIFPIDLCKRVIEYYSFKGDLIFDPFAGSGTLGRTAKSMGRRFFLTEKENKYFEYMKTFLGKNHIFDKEPTKFLTVEQFKETII
ncbi:MAG: HEAT repeat domain-containing protein [Prevotella sp.]|nr:HEAT repeat domain-containing protein [Prevotella sp.]